MRKWRLAALAALMACSFTAAQAETTSFEGLSQILLSSEQDHDVGELLAMIESQDRALEQALPYLRQQAFFSRTRLQAEYHPALALVLAHDLLAFAPKANAGSQPMAQYKIKLRYDSLRFPDKADSYLQKNYFGVALIKRALERNKLVAAQGRSYLQKVRQAQDPGYLQMLREGEGKRLSLMLKTYRMSIEAEAYYRREQYDKALELLDKAIGLSPEDADLYMFRAVIAAGDKKYDAAIKDLNRAIALAPEEATFYLLRGNTYFAQGILYDKSRQDYNRTLELESDIGLAYFMRGYTQQVFKDCPAANADFKKACDLGMSDACDASCRSF